MSLKSCFQLSAACALVLLCVPGLAHAQAELEVETIEATGSRITQAGLDTPTPVTALTAVELRAVSAATIADALNTLPSLTQTGGQQSNIGAVNTGKNILNLRGLGTTRTLILMDGMRFPTTETTNTVDVDVLPQALVRRVDIVTGGASASYGSDAVAGVVNFILDNTFEGVEGKLGGGTSEYGDNLEFQVSGSAGKSFFGGRLHVIASGEYFDSFGIPGDAREIRRIGPNVVAGPPGSATNLILVPELRTVSSFGGYVASATGGTAAARAAVTGLQFSNTGQLIPYNRGTVLSGSYQSGGDGVNTGILQDIGRPLRRRSAFLRAQYEINDDVTISAALLWGHKIAQQNDGLSATGSRGVTIGADNPFLAPATAASLRAAGITSLGLTKYFRLDEFLFKNDQRTTTNMATVGLKGKLGSFDWGASAVYGYAKQRHYGTNDLNWDRFPLAADATTNAAGVAVCRSTLTNPANGCVPANIFGSYNISQSSINYFTGQNPLGYAFETEGAEAHISGPLFELPAGPVFGAAGVEYRRQRATVTSTPESAAGSYQLGSTQPWAGGYDVSEGFVEIGVPLVSDASFARSIDLNLAIRETYYSTSKWTMSWKAGIVYKLDDEINFRTTYSRDIRAPNPSELFTAGSQGTGNVNDPFNGNVTVRNITTLSTGNTALKPEKGVTFTAGVGYSPMWLPGFSLTVDYYDIIVKDVLASTGAQNIVNFCFQGAAEYCPFVRRNGAGTITGVVSAQLNQNSLRTNGVDLEMAYTVPAAEWFDWWQGDLSVRSFTRYLGLMTSIAPGAAPVRTAGELRSANPYWQGTAMVNYSLGNWSTFLQVRYFGAGKINKQYNDPTLVPYQTANFNTAGFEAYLDLQQTYRINDNISVSLNIRNLLDTDPMLTPTNSTNYSQTTIQPLYDQVGRMFRASVRFDY